MNMKQLRAEIPNYTIRADGRVEWICEHGCGHPLFVIGVKNPKSHWFIHGCCGCEPTLQDLKQLIQSIRHKMRCEKCGASPIEWHHDDHPEKPWLRVSSLINRGSVSAVLKELNRCQRLCRKCHMEIDGRAEVLRERCLERQGKIDPPKECELCGKLAKPLRKKLCYTCYEHHRVGGRNYKGHPYESGCCK